MTSPAEATYKLQTDRLRTAYITALKSERFGWNTDRAWHNFAEQLKLVLQWVDVSKAATLRARATGKRLAVPQMLDTGWTGEKPLDLARLVQANPWLASHSEATSARINQLVEFIAGKERIYGKVWAQSKRAKVDQELIPAHRLEMFYRQGVKETATNSEQRMLDDPKISDKYPFVEYVTKDDVRVRPTHAVMHGFLACRWDEEGVAMLRIVSPPAGYNCRCTLKLITVTEARSHGWMGAQFVPFFAFKWPNRMAEYNFNHGVFPDRGWGSERNRYVAEPQLSRRNRTWQERYREAGGKLDTSHTVEAAG